MDTAQVVVSVGGLALSAFIAWFFWLSRKEVTRVTATRGVQEVSIVVKGGYTPDVIAVQAGKPVWLRFTRQESSACSETVILDGFDKSAFLPEGKTVSLEFTPQKPGEYDFHCQMNMLRGKLIVE